MSQSSGDLLADRRFAWAMALLAEEDFAGAADLLDQALALAPLWAPAWSWLGDARERLDESELALAAWRQAAALDPEGRLGAALKIARHRGEAPGAMPDAYVKALFDDYAPRFERHLVEGLRYRGPDLLAKALSEAVPRRTFGHALDLGCGTGLMGQALQGHAERIDGIDLSPAMVARAGLTGCYATLSVASIDEALDGTRDDAYDLVTAADVLVYVGDLAPVFRGIHRALAPGGILAFTLQAATKAGTFDLGPDLRFAHAPDYVEAALEAAGFDGLVLDAASTRTEKGSAVPGLLVIAKRA